MRGFSGNGSGTRDHERQTADNGPKRLALSFGLNVEARRTARSRHIRPVGLRSQAAELHRLGSAAPLRTSVSWSDSCKTRAVVQRTASEHDLLERDGDRSIVSTAFSSQPPIRAPRGYYGDSARECTWSASTVTRYQKRISVPLLDRIDIHVDVPRDGFQKLTDDRLGEPSAAMLAGCWAGIIVVFT